MKTIAYVVLGTVFLLLFALFSSAAFGHCDTMNGPVVKAARNALKTGDINLVLIWVQKKDEPEIRAAFDKTLLVRKQSPEAQALADMYFFETLVRIHRAGEGAPYTGLKSGETEVEPGIAAADRAMESGSGEELVRHMREAAEKGVQEKFATVMAAKGFKPTEVEAGRGYVKAYVEFIHYVERLHQALSTPVSGHVHEAEGVGSPQHEH